MAMQIKLIVVVVVVVVVVVMYISGTKFEEHCLNISRNMLDSVFYYFSCTVYHVITLLISIIQKR